MQRRLKYGRRGLEWLLKNISWLWNPTNRYWWPEFNVIILVDPELLIFSASNEFLGHKLECLKRQGRQATEISEVLRNQCPKPNIRNLWAIHHYSTSLGCSFLNEQEEPGIEQIFGENIDVSDVEKWPKLHHRFFDTVPIYTTLCLPASIKMQKNSQKWTFLSPNNFIFTAAAWVWVVIKGAVATSWCQFVQLPQKMLEAWISGR